MKRRTVAFALAMSLMLPGCGWLDGNYYSVTPYEKQQQSTQPDILSAANSLDLMIALESMISQGTESAVIQVAAYPTDSIETGMDAAIHYAQKLYPVGAYAVEEIHYEVGTSSGVPAIAVTITYCRSRSEIQMIRKVADMAQAQEEIVEVLESYEAGVVLLVDDYQVTDFVQFVEDYADEHPETLMETPQVTAVIHGVGEAKVVELTFTYQNSRESLRQMQSQVQMVFESAVLYVSGDGEDRQKLSQLYGFLMERFDYTIETSITPSYSLLRHGVGDSRAFAIVYAAMCRSAGLECLTVTGTCNGEARTWNIVKDNERYYHVDLLRCSVLGGFREFTDEEMTGYVWDYSAYPECPRIPEGTGNEDDQEDGEQSETLPESEQTVPTTPLPEETEPEEIPTEQPGITPTEPEPTQSEPTTPTESEPPLPEPSVTENKEII